MPRRARYDPGIIITHSATATRMQLLYFILAAYGMTFMLVYGSIFNHIRPRCGTYCGLGKLFHCTLCMGFWVGVFLWGVSPYTELFNFDYTIVNAFICGCISAGTSYFLSAIVDDEGISVIHKGGKDNAEMETTACPTMLQG